MKTLKIKQECSLCKKEPPSNNKLSNKNWTVYDTKNPCECGGKWTIKVM